MEHYCGHDVIAAPRQGPRRYRFEAQNAIALFGNIITHATKTLNRGMTLVFVATVALAGEAPEFVAKGETNGGTNVAKPLPGYEAPGISSGEFSLKSLISLGVSYDSNILRTQSRVLPDYIFFVAPAFELKRDGGKHIEEVFASFVSTKYAQSDVDDFTNINVGVRETYLLSPTSQILVNASVADGYERRVSSNHDIPTDAAEPVHAQALRGSLSYRKSWENVASGTTLTIANQTFDNVKSTTGVILDQTVRDETGLSVEAFVKLHLFKHIQSKLLFSAGQFEIRDQTRSSNQWKFLDTINIDLTSKTSVGFSAGVSEQDYYNNPQAQTRPLGEYEAWLRWSPIQRLAFTARGGYHDLGVDFATGITSGGVGRYGSLELEYLIWRNLQLSSGLRYEKADLSGDQGVQTSVAARTALTYELGSHAGLSFLYTFQQFDASSSQFTSYNENVFQTSLNLRF